MNLVITYSNSNIGKPSCHTMPLWHYEKFTYTIVQWMNMNEWINEWIQWIWKNEIYTLRNYIKLYRFIGIIIGHLDKWQKLLPRFSKCFHQHKCCVKGLWHFININHNGLLSFFERIAILMDNINTWNIVNEKIYIFKYL